VLELFTQSGPILQALIATIGTYLLTAIGTVPVLFFRSAPRRLMEAMMGFAGGFMVAAPCWSLLVPAIDSGGVLTGNVGPACRRCVSLRGRSDASLLLHRLDR
jgi:zinc transporter ZupT